MTPNAINLIHPERCCAGVQESCVDPASFVHSPDCPNKGRHVVIVGGGTAGWMTAATLRRRLQCRVTLIESDQVRGVGVGEATIPAMLDWIANMGIDEDEFLCKTDGTFKLAIRFDNWITEQHRYWHPFGECGATIDDLDLIHFFHRGVKEGWIQSELCYADFCLQKRLCDQHKAIRTGTGDDEDRPIVENYAYHLDAGRLASYVQDIAVSEGVEHIIGHVAKVQLNGGGQIESLCLAAGPAINGDLFVDCSGFAGILIEKAMGAAWTDWSDQLLCDRAVTARLPNKASGQPTAPYTISTGMDSGWAWQIPLRDVVGSGYVYSSEHVDDDEARRQLLAHIGASPETETRVLQMRVGFRPESWVANCVAIGLSSGFIEPLESTGIFSIQRALDELVNSLSETASRPPDHQQFNERMSAVYHEIRDFVLMHYLVSQRSDTPFWTDARAVSLPKSLHHLIDVYRQHGAVVLPEHDPVFAEANHHFILAGAGIAAAGESDQIGVATRYSAEDLENIFQRIRQYHSDVSARMPSHTDCLNSIYSPSRQSMHRTAAVACRRDE